MSVKYHIAGSATINGVVMINTTNSKVARAVRNNEGTVSVNELPIVNKTMRLYKSKIEKPVSKIPVIRELFKILLTFLIVVSSYITGVVEMFALRKRWSIKRIISIILLITGLCIFIFSDYYFTIAVLFIFIVYFNKEIVLMRKYHGAEHKCINMYENIGDISNATIEFAHTFSRTHIRCGTNIIILLIPLSMLYYFGAEQYLVLTTAGSVLDFLGGIILLGISIELFKLFQRQFMSRILKPGIWVQKYITTKEPDDSQLEVALNALKAVIE
jgi:uncharacterized protein YqhQ